MKLRSLACLMVCTVASFTASAIPIPPTVWGGNGHYYEVVNPTTGVTWQQAKLLAESSSFLGVNGHLATITSAAENNFVQSILPPGAVTYGYYLGGYQPPGSVEPAGGFVWVTSEPFSYTNWNPPDEPNDGYAGNPQNFLWMWSDYATANSGGTWAVGKWDDTWDNFTEYGGAQNSYIVEYAVPEPSSLAILSAAAIFLSVASKRRRS